jgi:hypothetical protein
VAGNPRISPFQIVQDINMTIEAMAFRGVLGMEVIRRHQVLTFVSLGHNIMSSGWKSGQYLGMAQINLHREATSQKEVIR